MFVSLNSQLVPTREAVIPVSSRAAAYGDGCFETLKSYQGRLLALDRHIDRLKEGMDHLGIRHPRETTEGRFAHLIGELLEANNLLESEARVRIQVWRNGPLGYPSAPLSDALLLLTAIPAGPVLPPLRLGWASTRRIPAACLPSRLKLSNGLNYILAQREVAEAGFDEALMCDIRGFISETTVANVFWIRDGVLETPALSCDPLPGIVRGLVLEMVAEGACPEIGGVREVEALPDTLLQASAVFTCNSLRELHPVASVSGHVLPPDNAHMRCLIDAWSVFRNEKMM